MVAKGDGLGHLQMGKARHDGFGMGGSLFSQGQLQVFQLPIEVIHAVADIEAEIRGNLVIARTRRVQASGGLTDNILQALLHIHVNVFQRCRKRELALFDLDLNLIKATGNFFCVGF